MAKGVGELNDAGEQEQEMNILQYVNESMSARLLWSFDMRYFYSSELYIVYSLLFVLIPVTCAAQ